MVPVLNKFILILALAVFNNAAAETIDIRFVVAQSLASTDASQHAIVAKLRSYIVQLNRYYQTSHINLQAEIVDIDFSPIAAKEVMTILQDMTKEQNGFAHMFAIAHKVGADYTVAVIDSLLIRGKPGCGRAIAINKTMADIASTRKAFAVINSVCGAHTLAHELGHLMGLNHGFLVDNCQPFKGHATALTPYANGYGEGNCDGKPQAGEFGDIMVGGWMKVVNGNEKSSLPFFSNANMRDSRCGMHKKCGNSSIGDAARVLNENARYYAGHENRN